MNLIASLKTKIPCSLKTEFTVVAFYQHSIFCASDMKFHAVAAVYLECYIIGSGMRNVIIVVVMAGMVPLGYNGSIYSQFG